MALKEWTRLVVDGSGLCTDVGRIAAEYALVYFHREEIADVNEPCNVFWRWCNVEKDDVSDWEAMVRSWEPVWDGIFSAPWRRTFAMATPLFAENKDPLCEDEVELRFYPPVEERARGEFKIAYHQEHIRGQNGFLTQFKPLVYIPINVKNPDHRAFILESLADGMTFQPRGNWAQLPRALLLHEQASLHFWAANLLAK